MDLRALIAKMDKIESKKFLTESEKKETSWTDMKGNKHGATKVKGKSYGNQPEPKEVDSEGKAKKKVKEGLGIADSLLESFGLKEQVANPYTGADAQKFASLTPQDQAWLTKGGGKPDINDPNILARAPNKGRPAAQPAAQPATAGVQGSTAATAAQPDGPDGSNASAAAPSQAKPQVGGANDGNAGDAEAQAAQANATPGKPSAPNAANAPLKWPTTSDEIKAFQMANNLKPDGLIGNQTMAALQKAGATPPAGFKPVANKVRPSQSGTPAATAPAATQSSVRAVDNDIDRKNAAAAANPQIAKLDAEIKKWQSYDPRVPGNKEKVAALQAQKDKILGAGVAQAAPGSPDESNPEKARLQRLAGLSTAPTFAADMAQRKAAQAASTPAWAKPSN
jgi:hypothetical protein